MTALIIETAVAPGALSVQTFPRLAELPEGEYDIVDLGRRCNELGGGTPRALVFGSGMNGPLGFNPGSRYAWATSLFGINPQQFGSPHFDDIYLRGAERCAAAMANPPADGLAELIVIPGLWDSNYQHFLVETLPLVHYINKIDSLRDTPILVHDQEHIRETLDILYPGRAFLFCKKEDSVYAKRALYFTPMTRNFDALSPIAIEALKALRERTIEKALQEYGAPAARSPLAYFRRIDKPEYAGRFRTMVNESELLAELEPHGVRVEAFDDLSLAQKAILLQGCRYAVSPIGANLMNFLFAPEGMRLLVIGHPRFSTGPWFGAMLEKLEIGLQSFEIYEQVDLADPNIDYDNAAYTVRAKGIGERISAWRAENAF